MAELTSLDIKQNQIKSSKLLKGLYVYIKPYKNIFFLMVILDVLVNISFNLEPLITRAMMNYINAQMEIEYSFSSTMSTVTLFIVFDSLIWFLGGIGLYLTSLKLKKIGQSVIKDMRDEMFSHILSLSLRQLREVKIGSYVTRVTNDTNTLSTLFSDILPQLLRAFMSIVVILVTTFTLTISEGVYYIGFIFLAYIPVVFLISYFFRKKAKKYYRAEKKAISEMNSFLSENFQGIKVVKTYNKEDKKIAEFDSKNQDIYSSFLHSQRLFAFFLPFMYFLQITCVVIVMATTLPSVVRTGQIGLSVGTFQLLYSYSNQFFQPIQTISNLLNQIEQIFTSYERVHVILDTEIEIEDKEGALEVPSFKGKIEFKHVYFSYDKKNPILKDISFTIQPGQCAAFVGQTGAGKSTIISLITRTYDVDEGEILIDDINVKDYSLQCLRKNIGVMLQDVFLFSGTVRDNITLFDESISLEKVKEACRDVSLERTIGKLENGYETVVKERGGNFSAGERQLISFARTIVYSPSLVLLDEATANIDTETEHIIQNSLERIKQIGTMVIVAHRLSTIKNADVIFVIDKGELIERGTHDELLTKGGIYYNLYRLQNMQKDLERGDI